MCTARRARTKRFTKPLDAEGAFCEEVHLHALREVYLRGMEATRSREPGAWLYEAVVLDARSPGEFGAGAVPGAVSFPLFDDEERAEVGTLYKRSGQERAIERGLEFVGPKLAGFVERARALHVPEREFAVYCARGGMRSGAVAWLLETAGLPVVKVEGGYKGYRRGVVGDLARGPWELRIVGEIGRAHV